MSEFPLATVGGLIIASDGEILLVRSKKWSNLYSLPGGKIELGETCEEAFRREVWEETHLKLVNIRFTIVQDCVFSPEFWQKRHFIMHDFIAELHPNYCKESVILNEEADTYRWIAPEKAETLPLHQECRYLIHWYLEHYPRTKGSKWGVIGVYHHRIRCIIGINPEERIQDQEIQVDVKVRADFSSCAISERIEETISYVKIAEICTHLAQDRKYQLLETFASEVLDRLMADFKVDWAWIHVQKPSALSTAEYAFVELERKEE